MGGISVKLPRDRNGEIESDLVPKYSRTVNGFDEKVITMYALGLSDKDIQEQIKEVFGCNLSPDMISDITNKIIPEIQEWQKRASHWFENSLYSNYRRIRIYKPVRINIKLK